MKFFQNALENRSRGKINMSLSGGDFHEPDKLPSLATPVPDGKLPPLAKSVSFADGFSKRGLPINLEGIGEKSLK
jgi:hypothetical protein